MDSQAYTNLISSVTSLLNSSIVVCSRSCFLGDSILVLMKTVEGLSLTVRWRGLLMRCNPPCTVKINLLVVYYIIALYIKILEQQITLDFQDDVNGDDVGYDGDVP